MAPGTVPVERRTDVDNDTFSFFFHGSIENALAHIESSKSIDFQNFLHTISRNLFCSGQEITGSTIDENIDLAEFVNNALNDIFTVLDLSDVSRF